MYVEKLFSCITTAPSKTKSPPKSNIVTFYKMFVLGGVGGGGSGLQSVKGSCEKVLRKHFHGSRAYR